MTIRVQYHVEGEIPKDTLGLALGIHRTTDLLKISHFSTGWLARDEDHEDYLDKPFRRIPGRKGVMECVIDPVQLAEGEYYVSVGLTNNNPATSEFYEQRLDYYKITILRNGHELNGLVYYPIVKWHHEIVE